MPTLWDIITNNSTLPVQAGNTLWDHLNNQGGSGGGLVPIPYSEIIIEEEVVVLEVSDYSDTITLYEAEVTTFTIIEQPTLLSFEE